MDKILHDPKSGAPNRLLMEMDPIVATVVIPCIAPKFLGFGFRRSSRHCPSKAGNTPPVEGRNLAPLIEGCPHILYYSP